MSRTLLYPKDKNHKGKLNALYKELKDAGGFNFQDYFYLDEEILGYLESLKEKYDLYVFTSGTIQNAPEIKPRLDSIFKKIFSTEKMGVNKSDKKAYTKLAIELNAEQDKILYVDDVEENTNAAKLAGMNAILFTDFINLQKSLQKHLFF